MKKGEVAENGAVVWRLMGEEAEKRKDTDAEVVALLKELDAEVIALSKLLDAKMVAMRKKMDDERSLMRKNIQIGLKIGRKFFYVKFI